MCFYHYLLLGLQLSMNLLLLSLGSQGIKIIQCSILQRQLNSVFVCVCTCTSGAKYSLLAYTTLCLPEAEGSFQSHSLIVLQNGKKKRQRNVISGDIKGLCFLSPHLIQSRGNDTIFWQKKRKLKLNKITCDWSLDWISFLPLHEWLNG